MRPGRIEQGGIDACCLKDDGSGLGFRATRPDNSDQGRRLLRPGKRRGQPSARWIGQDGHDYVGPSNRLEPSEVQDVHLALSGLDPETARSSSST